MTSIILNGNLLPSDLPCIHAGDRGLTLGHGLFETILVKKNTLPAIEYHWQRLVTSAPIIGIELPFTREKLESMIFQLITKNELQNNIAGARVTITHGTSERGIWPLQLPSPNFLISVFAFNAILSEKFTATVVSIRKNEHSPISMVKSLSYLDNILAKKEALDLGFDEGILLNTSLSVADGCISNVFIVKNNVLFTPLISDGALPGVMRSILLNEFKKELNIQEKNISLEELMNADEIFMTNALMGIKSLTKIGNRFLDSFEMATKARRLLLGRNYS